MQLTITRPTGIGLVAATGLFVLTAGCVPPIPGSSTRVAAAPRAPGATAAGMAAAATLQNTYWKMTVLGAAPIGVPAGGQEPHVILQLSGRVVGADGCERFAGRHHVDGQWLLIEIAARPSGTCDALELAAAVRDALRNARSWTVAGEQLELFDALGVFVARFESVYLR